MSVADNLAIPAPHASAAPHAFAPRAEYRRNLVLRIGAWTGIVGAILAFVAIALHPHPTDFKMETVLEQIAQSSTWGIIHLTLIIALLFVYVALVALTLSLEREPGATIGRIACVLTLLGGALLLVSTAIDGFAMNRVADDWFSAPAAEQAAALRTATALDEAAYAVYSLSTFLFMGLGMVFFGLATRLCGYPRWLSWLAILGGAGETVVGIVQLLEGPTYRGLELPDALFSVLITTWLLIVSILMWRRSQARITPPTQLAPMQTEI